MFSNSLKYSLTVGITLLGLTACGLTTQSGNPDSGVMSLFNDGGKRDANRAVVAYTQGNFDEADQHVLNALHSNKKNAQALLIGALLSEKTDRPNRARQFYEEILLYNGNEMSVLGSTSPDPQKITDIARKRLRQLNLSQNKLIIEDNAGNKVFNIDNQASVKGGTTAMEEALFLRQKKQGRQNEAAAIADRNAVEVLFDDAEKNTISRFIILKELAENDLITKEEFLRARQANIGGLLPLSQTPASSQVTKPVPTAAIIVDRINALKSAVEDRAITPKEFSAERNLIIEAVLPPRPTQRLSKKVPAKDIMSAAKDLRKLEVIYDLNLITTGEKQKEQAAIERNLGLKQEAPVTTPVVSNPTKPQEIPTIQEVEIKEVINTDTPPVTTETTISANKPSTTAAPLIPDVSSPFNK